MDLEILRQVAGTLMIIGICATLLFPEMIAGPTKEQREGKMPYPETQKKKKRLWFFIFLAFAVISGVLFAVGGGFNEFLSNFNS